MAQCGSACNYICKCIGPAGIASGMNAACAMRNAEAADPAPSNACAGCPSARQAAVAAEDQRQVRMTRYRQSQRALQQ